MWQTNSIHNMNTLKQSTSLLQLLELFKAGKDDLFARLLYLSCEEYLIKDSVYLHHS